MKQSKLCLMSSCILRPTLRPTTNLRLFATAHSDYKIDQAQYSEMQRNAPTQHLAPFSTPAMRTDLTGPLSIWLEPVLTATFLHWATACPVHAHACANVSVSV